MKYEHFLEELVREIRNIETVEGHEVKIEKEDNKDILYIALEKRKQKILFLRVNAEDVYQEYLKSRSMEHVRKEIERTLVASDKNLLADSLLKLRSYTEVKEHLFVRAVSKEKVKGCLDELVYRMVGDIFLLVCIELISKGNEVISTRLTKEIVKYWGSNEEEIWNLAMEKTVQRDQPRLYRLEKLIWDNSYQGDAFMDSFQELYHENRIAGNCISTERRVNGATAVFYPGVARRLSDLMGENDLYLVFTSIHEVMVHSVQDVSLEMVEKAFRETQEEEVPPEERLTTKVYRYSKKKDQIFIAEET